MNPLNWLQDPLMQESLGWTIIHFLWLGSIVWLLASAGRRALRRKSSAVRYGYALGCLGALTILPIVVFACVHGAALKMEPRLPPPSSLNSEEEGLGEDFPNFEEAVTSPASTSTTTPTQTVRIRLNLIRTLPFAWLFGTAICSATLALGAIGVERLRRSVIGDIDEELLRRLEELKERLSITGAVWIGYSDRVLSPVLIGLARPMILLPASLMSGLSSRQLEVVLLHELTHVRRHDNWVNLGQRVIEATLFFHPAIWMVSAWIREEREYCCDDEVLRRASHAREDYARTLAELAFPSRQLLGSAMAQKPLLNRIRNILNENEPNMKTTNKSVIPAVVCFAALNLLAYSAARTFAELANQSEARRPADPVLANVLKAYGQLTSYEASGSMVFRSNVDSDPPRKELLKARENDIRTDFSIWLARSNKIRMEWTKTVSQLDFTQDGIAVSNGETHACRSALSPDPITFGSYEGMFGVVQLLSSPEPSDRLITETARLFHEMPTELTNLTEALITGEDPLDGTDCWIVEGKNAARQKVTLWVSKANHLIHRCRMVFKADTSEALERIEAGQKEGSKLTPEARKRLQESLERASVRIYQLDFQEIQTNHRINPDRFEF